MFFIPKVMILKVMVFSMLKARATRPAEIAAPYCACTCQRECVEYRDPRVGRGLAEVAGMAYRFDQMTRDWIV